MPSLPRAIAKIAGMEMRLQIRSLVFWLILALWQGAVFVAFDPPGYPPLMATWAAVRSVSLLTTSAAVLYFMSALTREEMGGVSDLFDALPHRSEAVIWGKLAAGLALWLLLGFEMVAVLAVRHLGRGLDLGRLAAGAAFILAYHVGVVVLSAATGLLVSTLLGRSRLAYLVGIAAWLALGGVGPILLPKLLPGAGLGWVGIFSVAYPRDWSSLWGLAPASREAWLQSLWFLAAGLALAGLAGLAYRHRRDRDARRALSVAVLVIGVLVGGGSLTGYGLAYAGQMRAMAEQASVYLAMAKPTGGGDAPPVAVVNYDLAFVLGPAHSLAAEGTITVRNEGPSALESIPLTLNNVFTVDRVAAANGGRRVSGLGRNGDFLDVRLGQPLAPGEVLPLTISYGGTARGLATDVDLLTKFVAGVDEHGLWLPGGFGWYPVGGHQRLAGVVYRGRGEEPSGVNFGFSYERILVAPASYRLSFQGAGHLGLASSFGLASRTADGTLVVEGRAAGTQGIFILGGSRLAAAEGETGKLVGAPEVIPSLAVVSARLAPALAFYRRALPVAVPGGLVAVPEGVSLVGGPASGESLALAEAMAIGQARTPDRWVDRAAAEGYALERDLLNLTFDCPRGAVRFGGAGLAVRQAFADFLEAAAVGAAHGESVYRERLEHGPVGGSYNEPGEAAAYRDTLGWLREFFGARGEDGLRRLLAAVWNEMTAGGLTPRELRAALRTLGFEVPASGGAPQ